MGRRREGRAVRLRATILALAALTLLCIVAFGYVLRQVSFISVGLAAHDEVEAELRQSIEDQKKLAALDPKSAQQYRQRYETTRELMGHLYVLALSRQEITRRIEIVLLIVVALILTGATALFLAERRRIHARQRRRLQYLEHLSTWQEAARRHAHEIRTPLTCAQMEVERLVRAARNHATDAEIAQARESILEELDRLNEFTKSFTSFAKVAKPRPQRVDLDALIADFCTTFSEAWPQLHLERDSRSVPAVASVDREMLRQVFVNLCNNSALAGARAVAFRVARNGVNASIDVSDDGPGVVAEVRGRLFEPYSTTRPIGQGMGLGLAISKKILLDHGGDLELAPSRAGATFRMTIPLETSQ
jgi:signal transduction histidine kinase